MNTGSLRFRLVFWYVLWLSAVFVAFGALIYLASRHYLMSSLEEILARRAHQVADLISAGETASGASSLSSEIETRLAPAATSRFVRVTRETGEELYRSQAPYDSSFDPRAVPRSASTLLGESFGRRSLAEGQSILVFNRPVHTTHGNYIVEFGTSATPVDLTLRRMLVAFALALPVLVTVAASGGYVLVQRALNPVDEIIRTAEKISSHNLGDRLPVPPTGDELERLSLALNNMIRRLDEAFQHNRQFMADTSHELRTPLTVMAAELEDILLRRSGDEEMQQLAENLLAEVQRLAGIVAGLLALSRLDAREPRPAPVRFDLSQLVTGTTEQISVLASEKSQTITCTTSGPVMVQADPAELKQVTVNLLDNAIKYTPAGSRIQVCVFAAHETAVLEVSDTGPGIPTEALPHLFDRFYRVDKAFSRELGGTGLGLSIVKSICNAHGGTVQVQSIRGEGTRFRVDLPLASGRAEGGR